MNRKEQIESARNHIAKSGDLLYLTETSDNIIWCLCTCWDSITEILSRKNIGYEYLGEIKYRFFDMDLGNSGIDEYKYKSSIINDYIYVYEWWHGVVDTVDFVSYFSLKRLDPDEIHNILRLHDTITLENIKKMREED